MKIDLNTCKIESTTNRGNAKEASACAYFGIERTKHDSTSYDTHSDIELPDLFMSVKSESFTLMSGGKCKGCKTFEGIWRRFRKNVHSDWFMYVTNEYTAYIMDIDKFSKFVHKFTYLDRESKKNGGGLKIKSRTESKAMLAWLEENCA